MLNKFKKKKKEILSQHPATHEKERNLFIKWIEIEKKNKLQCCEQIHRMDSFLPSIIGIYQSCWLLSPTWW